MILKAAILTLALVAVSGYVPDISEDLVANVVWDYLSQQSAHAKDQVQQKAELTQQLRNLFQNHLLARMYNKTYTYDVKDLVPFAINVHRRLTQDLEKQKEETQKELEDLRARMLPHAQEVSQKIGDNVDRLQETVTLYPKRIYIEIGFLRWTMNSSIQNIRGHLEKAQSTNGGDLQALLTSSFNEVEELVDNDLFDTQEVLIAYEHVLKTKIGKHVHELGLLLVPFAQDVQENLSHQLDGLSFRMKKVAGLLLANVSAEKEELSHRLMNLTEDAWEKLTGTSEEGQKALAELGQQLDQQIEEFQRTLAQYNGTFQKVLEQLLEDFGQKLGPNAGSSDDHLIFLEKELKDNVKAFFNTILKDFHEKQLALEIQARKHTLGEQAENRVSNDKNPTPLPSNPAPSE